MECRLHARTMGQLGTKLLHAAVCRAKIEH